MSQELTSLVGCKTLGKSKRLYQRSFGSIMLIATGLALGWRFDTAFSTYQTASLRECQVRGRHFGLGRSISPKLQRDQSRYLGPDHGDPPLHDRSLKVDAFEMYLKCSG